MNAKIGLRIRIRASRLRTYHQLEACKATTALIREDYRNTMFGLALDAELKHLPHNADVFGAWWRQFTHIRALKWTN